MNDSAKIAAEKAELRELIREAHGAMKDLRQAAAEARQLARRLAGQAAREVSESIAAEQAKVPQQAPDGPPGVLRCPDCTGAARPGRVLDHDKDCPLGAAIEAVAGPDGTDARWFREHPEADQFCREITPAEKTEFKAYGPAAQDWARDHGGPLPEWVDIAYTKVLVTRINDDSGEMCARARRFVK